jgi:hypothetical protein
MSRVYKPYNTRIQKGGALLDDMRMLVRSWEEDNSETRAEIRRLLGKKTLARSQDTMVITYTMIKPQKLSVESGHSQVYQRSKIVTRQPINPALRATFHHDRSPFYV